MDKLVINGPARLKGAIAVSGAKNAALPVMAGALLSGAKVSLSNIPRLRDVDTMGKLLETLGVRVDGVEGGLTLLARPDLKHEAPYNLVRTMRASVLVLGPLVARLGKARVSLPGGCAIGTRPIDIHLKGLSALGADISIREGYVEAKSGRLHGAKLNLEFPSVTATENLMMAAALAEGTTVIANAAQEPEIADLGDFINAGGGSVSGAGTGTVIVTGVRELGPVSHRLIPDRLEAGSWLLLAALTGCGLAVSGARREDLGALESALAKAGISIVEKDGSLRVSCADGIEPVDISTMPHPGFPTDMQAQWMTMMCFAKGSSVIRENIFENRFQHVPELARMGADITVRGNTAVVKGVGKLTGAPVMVSDLRAGIALVLASLSAEGKSEIRRIYHLDRGYEDVEHKLAAVGADIKRVPQDA